jgi:hypothetical protein
MGKPLKMGALLVVGATMPISSIQDKAIRRGEPAKPFLISDFLLGPISSCKLLFKDKSCFTNKTHFYFHGGEYPDYLMTADGKTTTKIYPKTQIIYLPKNSSSHSNPTSSSDALTSHSNSTSSSDALLFVKIVSFCMSVMFYGLTYRNSSMIRQTTNTARNQEPGDVEMATLPPSTNVGARSPSLGSQSSNSLGENLVDHPLAQQSYRDV